MGNRSVLYGVLALVLVVLFAITQFRLQPDARPPGTIDDVLALSGRDDLNILFVLVDTLRADRLGAYGYARDTSATIDHLAETGIIFKRHYSQSSWTKTSMASIWTGIYPHRNGILRYNDAIPKSAFLPAEALQEAGFVTAGIWRNGWVSPTFGFHQGFDLYHRPSPGLAVGFKRRDEDNPYARIEGSDIEVTEGAREFLRVNGHQRFFLYVHYMDAHQYMSDADSALFGNSYSDLYDNSIHWTDRHIATLVEALDAEGIRDETIVVIASDHGEAFGEHGKEGHAKDLHKEVIQVPWIISLPFSLSPGISVDTLSENVDLFPTLFDLIGQPPLDYADGRSRLPEILTAAGRADARERDPDASPLFSQLDRAWGKAEQDPDPMVALTLPDRRFMRSLSLEEGGRARTPKEAQSNSAFYRTDTDPLEKDNLLREGADQVDTSEAEGMLIEVLARPPPPWRDDVEQVELSDMQKGQLKAIGYAIE